MNINEDKFANKSAEEIVDDVLLQHKNNTKDALAYIQSLSTVDGLISSENLAKLKKAEDLLKTKAKKEALVEKFWPFDVFKKHYDIELSCMPPFMKEPVKITIEDTTGFDDPKVLEAYKKLRNKHPKSTIYAKNPELGRKTFYENTIKDFELKLYKDNNLIESAYVGNLPIARKLSELACENNNYTKVEIFKENKLVDIYNKLKDKKFEWKNKNNNIKKSKQSKVPHDTELSKLIKDFSNNSNVQNIGANLLSTATGIAPQFLTGVTKALTTAVGMPFKKAFREDTNYGTSDNILNTDYINPVQDTNKIDNRILLALHGIHPNLIDIRKPKLNWPEKWHNMLLTKGIIPIIPAKDITNNPDKLSAPTQFVISGVYNTGKPLPTNEELTNPDLLNQYKNKYISDDDYIVITPKIPYIFNGYSKKTEKPMFGYKNGNPFLLSVKNVKRLLNNQENNEALSRFEDKNDTSDAGIQTILNRDITAKEYMDNSYDEWENAYKDKYNLTVYDLPTRGNIYVEWKKYKNENKELDPEIVYEKFFLPFYRDKLIKTDDTLVNTIENLLITLPEKEKQDLTKKYLNLISETPENELSKKLIQFKQEIGQNIACWNQLNEITNGNLYRLENEISNIPTLAKIFNKFKTQVIENSTLKEGPFKGLPDLTKINSSDFKKYLNSTIEKFNSKLIQNVKPISKEKPIDTPKTELDNLFDDTKTMVKKIPDVNITDEKRQEYLDEIETLKSELIDKQEIESNLDFTEVLKVLKNFKDKVREETGTKRTSIDKKLSNKYDDALYAELNKNN